MEIQKAKNIQNTLKVAEKLGQLVLLNIWANSHNHW